MNILNIIKLSKQLSKFVSIPYADGNLICDGELEVGKELFIEDASGNLSPAAGEYETDDKIIRVENGIISEIVEKEESDGTEESAGTEEQTQNLEDETKSESKDNGSVDDDKDKKIAELEAKVAELEAKIAELTSSMNFVKEELAKPVENFSSSKKNQKPLFKTYWG